MKVIRTVAVLGLAIVLAACPPRDRPPETAVDTPAARPAGPVVPPVLIRPVGVQLAPMHGGETVGQAVIAAENTQTDIVIDIRSPTAGASFLAHLVTAPCDQDGPVAADLQPVTTDDTGTARSRTVVGMPPGVVLNGSHSLRLFSDRDPRLPIACGDVPRVEAEPGTAPM